jgi:hypothetical protein
MATDNSAPGFARDIQPLFRQSDRDSMLFAFDLWNYNDVRTYSKEILERLEEGSMPCDGKWPVEQISTFQRWIESGMSA